MPTDSIVITSIARTPQGKLLGILKDISSTQLGAIAIQAAVERAGLQPNQIDEVIMGCVLPAGLGQAPARQAALKAHLPTSTNCLTINKVCGSGMKAIMLAHDCLLAGTNKIFVAGGMESMSNAPYLVLKGRSGYRMGHGQFIDHMLWDGLEDAYDNRASMGLFADQCAEENSISREDQDAYAIESLTRARRAIEDKTFQNEIVEVLIHTKQGEEKIVDDEHPFSVKPERLTQLPASFVKEGTVTAGNSSSIADGAAAVTVMRAEEAARLGIKPLAQIVGHACAAKLPKDFTIAPIDAIQLLLKKIGWHIDEVDLFEINEAFAVVAILAMKGLNIPREKLNIHGGGCALGHPIGATGARLIVTLIAALQKQGLKKGIACLCIGGGEATALAIEIME